MNVVFWVCVVCEVLLFGRGWGIVLKEIPPLAWEPVAPEQCLLEAFCAAEDMFIFGLNMTWFNNLIKLCFSSPKITCLDSFVLPTEDFLNNALTQPTHSHGMHIFPIHSNNKELCTLWMGKKYASCGSESAELAQYWGSLPSEDETV